MTRKIAFIGFDEINGTDINNIASVVGVDAASISSFTDLTEGVKFLVHRVNGQITAVEGAELFVSAAASDETIQKARKIKAIGVVVNLDWEPFRKNYSANELSTWLSDGEWIDDVTSVVDAPVANNELEDLIDSISYVDETPDPVQDAQVYPTPDFEHPVTDPSPVFEQQEYQQEYTAETPSGDYAPSEYAEYPPVPSVQEAPTEYASPDYAPAEYPSNEYAAPVNDYADNAYAEPSVYAEPAPSYETPVEQAPVDYSQPVNDYSPPVQDDEIGYEEPKPVPFGFLQTGGEPVATEQVSYPEPTSRPEAEVYAEPQQPAYQDYAPVEYASPDTGSYPPPVQEEYYQEQNPPSVPMEQQYAAPDYASVPAQLPPPQEENSFQYAPPTAEPLGGYSPPSPQSAFIQESPSPAPFPNRYQQERAVFEQMPAGVGNDFESKDGGKLIYITGSHGGAGKTTTAWTLASLVAVSLKQSGNTDTSVWLIESDYRNSKLAQRHNIDPNRTSGHLAAVIEQLQNESGMIADLPQKKAQAIADSTHRLDNGLNIIACPYDTTRRETKYIQQAVFQAAQFAKMQGGIVFIDADTISNDDLMDSKLAKSSDRVVIVSDGGEEHIDDLKRAAKILTTSHLNGGLGVPMHNITVLLNKTGADEFKRIEESERLAPLALGGYLPFIQEWATGWVGSLTNTDTFKNAVVLFARFFNEIVPMEELRRWENYRVSPTKKDGWVRKIFSSKKAK